jgi:CRISPR-associated endonuclease/helicase Cas3
MATPADRDLTPFLRRGAHGLGSVYPDLRVVEATWRLLGELSEFTIPAMNRELVEKATHPDALAAIEASLGRAWVELGQRIVGETAARRGIAALHGIDRDEPFGDCVFPDLDERIRTRLGADDRLVDWRTAGIDPPTGPFGRAVHALTIPHPLCRGIEPQAVPSTPEQRPEGFVFMLGSLRFDYGRHGLRPAAD